VGKLFHFSDKSNLDAADMSGCGQTLDCARAFPGAQQGLVALKPFDSPTHTKLPSFILD
jgi:hypothetical protein